MTPRDDEIDVANEQATVAAPTTPSTNDTIWWSAECDTCGDCSNSDPDLPCGRLIDPTGPAGYDDDHPDAVPCTGTYRAPKLP